jgi:hypothetical protein
MTEVQLNDNWSDRMSITEFNAWSKAYDVEWDFRADSMISNPIIIFEHESDAIAFKIRFSV